MAIYGNLIKDDLLEEGTYIMVVDENAKKELLKNWNTQNEKHKREVFKSDNVSEQDYQMLVETYNTIRQCETYSEYKKAFDKLCKFCHITPKGTIITKCNIRSGSSKDRNSIIVEYSYNTKKITLPEGTKLYHMSKVAGIKELIPQFRGKSAKGFLYNKPRIYLTIKKSMPKFMADYKLNEKMHKYEVKNPPTDVYVDPLVWGKMTGAVYVETNKPLPVEEMGIPKKKSPTNESAEVIEEGELARKVGEKMALAAGAAAATGVTKYALKQAEKAIENKKKQKNTKEDREMNKRERELKRQEKELELAEREKAVKEKQKQLEKEREKEAKEEEKRKAKEEAAKKKED